MNLPNKLTMTRIIISFFIIAVLMFPFDTMGLSLPKIFIDEAIVIDTKYLKAFEEGKIYIHDIPYYNLGYLSLYF